MSELPARVPSSKFGVDNELAEELPPQWNLQRFQAEANSALKEFFVALAVDDEVVRLRELLAQCRGYADELGVLAIRGAIDRDHGAKEAVVDLLQALSKAHVVDTAAMVRAFEKLFCTWEDIAIDAPKAPATLTAILLRCVSLQVVGKDLLSKVPENLMSAVLSQSELDEGQEQIREAAARLKEFKSQMTIAMEGFFVSADVSLVDRRLRELGRKEFRHELVKKAIIMSFEQSDPTVARESVLALFAALTSSGLLCKDDLQWGVSRVLGQLTDLELDCPRAQELLVEFITCLVADELVSVPFLRRCRILRIGGSQGMQVLDAAVRKTPEYSKRQLGTLQFKREIHTMILEYFNSSDQAEFKRCVSELQPLPADRGAELVRKIMLFAMERSSIECEKSLKLLVGLCRDEELSPDVLENGFDDLYRVMSDLILDVPDAPEMAKAFAVEAKKAHVLRDDWPIPAKYDPEEK